MFRKLSLRGRLVLLMTCLLAVCLVLLTLLNYRSASTQIQNTAFTAVKIYSLSQPIDVQARPETENGNGAGGGAEEQKEDSQEPEGEPKTGSQAADSQAQTEIAEAERKSQLKAEPVVPAVKTQVAAGQKLFRVESLISLLVMVLAGGVITYFTAGKCLRPVRKLAGRIKNMNEYNLTERMEVPETGDEIADLARSFNEMFEKLDDAFEARRRFSADAAHELRTPLAVLTTKLEVFRKRKDHTKEEYDALLDTMAAHTARLSGLVSDLLVMTEIEEVEEKEEISAAGLIEEVFADLGEVAETYRIGFGAPSGDAGLTGNYTLLYRVFYNLTENAVKYNHPGGLVDARISREAGWAVISISDTGQGVPEGMEEKIFEPFFRADKSRSRKMGGAGIGLSVVKNIVEKHGGTIKAEKRPEGGSIFTVRLPMR